MVKVLERFWEWLWSGPESTPRDNSLASPGGMCRSQTLPGRQLHEAGLFWMKKEFNSMDTGYSMLVGLKDRELFWAGLIHYDKESLRIFWSCKGVSYSYADDPTGIWCLQEIHGK